MILQTNSRFIRLLTGSRLKNYSWTYWSYKTGWDYTCAGALGHVRLNLFIYLYPQFNNTDNQNNKIKIEENQIV